MTAGRLAFPAMLIGSICLAFGPWLVRIADVAPVASAFWRMSLAAVPLMLLARGTVGPLRMPAGGLMLACAAAALFFAADLAAWHLGIARTTLANAALMANGASFMLPAYSYIVSRTLPGRNVSLALVCAGLGTALLIGRSADVSAQHLLGDLLCLSAAAFYTGYLVIIDRFRRSIPALPLLALVTLFSLPMLLPMALIERGAFWPHDWTPLIVLALGSQVIGQGLVVYAVGHLKPIVVGIALLVQPAIGAAIGALRFHEVPGAADIGGAALVVVALLLVRLPERGKPLPTV